MMPLLPAVAFGVEVLEVKALVIDVGRLDQRNLRREVGARRKASRSGVSPRGRRPRSGGDFSRPSWRICSRSASSVMEPRIKPFRAGRQKLAAGSPSGRWHRWSADARPGRSLRLANVGRRRHARGQGRGFPLGIVQLAGGRRDRQRRQRRRTRGRPRCPLARAAAAAGPRSQLAVASSTPMAASLPSVRAQVLRRGCCSWALPA